MSKINDVEVVHFIVNGSTFLPNENPQGAANNNEIPKAVVCCFGCINLCGGILTSVFDFLAGLS